MASYELNGSNISVTIEDAMQLSVNVGESAALEVGQAINYIQSGRAELQPLVIAAAQSANNAETSAQNASDSATAALSYAERAETAAQSAENMADKDLSNLSETGEAKFDAKQDVIRDLSEIRQGAALGATAVQPSELESYATTQYVDNGLSGKQDALVSGGNIKTINGQSVLGNGNLVITSVASWGNITGTLSAQTDLQNALNAKANVADIPTATSDLTNDSGFITLSALSGYATQTWVENKGYLTEIPEEYVTDSELTAKGYQTAADVETAITAKGYTTMSAVEAKGYITDAALVGYATETWVGQQGFITGITSSDVTTALGYTPYNSSNPSGYITSTALTGYATESYVTSAVSGKQDTLVSGTNIKTINNQSLLGSGNIDIQGGGGSSYTAGDGIDITNNVISAKIATSVSSTSTNEQSVGAKLFYDTVGDVETLINAL